MKKVVLIASLALMAIGFNACKKEVFTPENSMDRTDFNVDAYDYSINKDVVDVLKDMFFKKSDLASEIFNLYIKDKDDEDNEDNTEAMYFKDVLTQKSSLNFSNLFLASLNQRFQNDFKAKNMDKSFLDKLYNQNTELYWPNIDDWDGSTSPTITFYDGENDDENIGYRYENGEYIEVLVNEEYIEMYPVWIVTNNDAEYDEMSGKKHTDDSDYLTEVSMKSCSFNSNHNYVRIKTEWLYVEKTARTTHYESIFLSGLEFRWYMIYMNQQGLVVSPQVRQVHLNISKYDFKRARKKNRQIKLGGLLIGDWRKEQESVWVGCYEYDRGKWNASGNSSFKTIKNTQSNLSVFLPVTDNINFTGSSSTNSTTEHNAFLNWKIESKDPSLGGTSWARSLPNTWSWASCGKAVYYNYSGLKTRFNAVSFN